MTVRFAAIGLDHRHIYDLTAGLIAAGATCAGHCPVTSDPRVLEGFRKRFPDVPALARERMMDDPAIAFVVSAAIPSDRAALAMAAMRRGKDVMLDKPGIIRAADLAAVERTIAETGRILSICFSERLTSPVTGLALRMVAGGAIGRVIQVVGLGPHRLNRALRPAWFFDVAATGGILADIGSHQIDSFLAFSAAQDAEIVASTVANMATPANPLFEDFGEILLKTGHTAGYARLDWFTPDGLPSWGDGRQVILGTDGTIELRKNVDIAGRHGGNHLFLVDRHATRHIDAGNEPVTYFAAFLHDVLHRTETASPQAHMLTVTRLALEAQARAERRNLPAAP
jgi:predicted dehydrogenase